MKKTVYRILGLVPALGLQFLWIGVLTRWLSKYSAIINLGLSLLAVIFVLYIFGSRFEGTYKTLWLFLIVGFPIFGTFLYMSFGNKKMTGPLSKKLQKGKASLGEIDLSERDVSVKHLPDRRLQGKESLEALLPKKGPLGEGEVWEELGKENARLCETFGWVAKSTGFALHRVEEATYYPLGELAYAAMLEDLRAAEHFIYAEYFILEEGKMWDSMVEVMAERAAGGVDVRVMYDDIGSISTYNLENIKKLKEKGIHCIPFNPMVFIRGTLNYRDHRKMLIVDGKVAYSGGINLADEYINAKERFGHWKDVAFRLTGAPVENYVRMFTEFWNAFADNPAFLSLPVRKKPLESDISLPAPSFAEALSGKGYCLSYYDSPAYPEAVSNNLYIELLSQATRYAWFYTPYLMLGDALLDAFIRAASRGVDVRLILPGIPDKKLVYRMSRGYYDVLLAAGVRIFEYTPGFVHAKACLVDDVVGTVGTVNLDYRSLFLHFENNSLFYKAELLQDLKEDYE